MTRYTTLSIVSDPVPGTSHLDIEGALLVSQVDLAKIKVVPSDGTGTNVIEIYKSSARQFNRLLYRSAPFTGLLYVDPVDSGGGELNESFIAPYYDEDENLKLHIRIINNHSSAKTYTIDIEYDAFLGSDIGVLGSPDKVTAVPIVNGLAVTIGLMSELFKEGVVEAELRAQYVAAGNYGDSIDLRTVAEGGSFVPNGTTSLLLTQTGNFPTAGVTFSWTSAAQGRWFVAGRLRNSTGWSLWTDGNPYPKYVSQFIDTQTFADTGPPADWKVSLEPGPTANTVIVHASRPKTNGNNLLWWSVQVKDANSGAWRALDANAGAAVTYYDGSAVAHTYGDGFLSKATDGWGTAQVGDLVVVDVRTGTFDINYCQWFLLGEGAIESNRIYIGNGLHAAGATDIRIKIVAPPWEWNTEGYLGGQANLGFWPGPGTESAANGGLGLGWIAGDFASQEFVTTPIPVPEGSTNIEARVWFENLIARSDNNLTHSSNTTEGYGGSGCILPNTFTNFGDRTYWVPIYPASSFGSLNPGGQVSMSISGSSSLSPGCCGVRSRFRVHAGVNYQVTLKAVFTGVTLPVGIASTDILFLGIGLADGILSYGDLWLGGMSIIGTEPDFIKIGTGTYPRMNYDYTANGIKTDPFARGYSAYLNTTVERFPAGSTVEIIYHFERNSSTLNFAPKNVQYRIGGGDWVTTTLGATPKFGTFNFRGADVFLGFFSNCKLAASATLTSFEIINGLGEVF